MALSHELISQFAKVVNSGKKQNTETTIYGTVVDDNNGNKYVRPDGSDQLIPITENEGDAVKDISTTATTEAGDRVSVMIKDHSATVTGNTSSPATNNKEVGQKISEFDIAVGEQIQANKAYFQELMADKADLGSLVAAIISVAELIASDANIENLIADKATISDLVAKKIDADVVVADTAIVDELKAEQIDVLGLIADKAIIHEFIANDADINTLEAKNAYLKFANVDFSNIGEAAIEKLFTDSGVIKDLIMSDGRVTGELIGVTIKGDLVEAGTIKVDRLIVKGSDDNYYALSTDFEAMPGVTPVEEDAIHGSVLVKKSIVAEKIAVDDLHAFDATIGGFNIRGNSTNEETGETIPGAIYSGVKSSVDNTTIGSYLDNDGQFAFGDSVNFIRYYKTKDENGNVTYKLAISADDITFGHSGKSASDVADLADRIKIGTYVDPDTGKSKPSIELDEEFGDEKVQLTNETIVFTSENVEGTKLTRDKVSTKTVEQEGWEWAPRANGNYGLMWKGAVN